MTSALPPNGTYSTPLNGLHSSKISQVTEKATSPLKENQDPSTNGQEISAEQKARELARPFFYILKHFSPQEPDAKFSELTEEECKKILFWLGRKDYLASFVGTKVVRAFNALPSDYIQQQFDRILKEKRIEVEKISSEEKIKTLVYDIFWQFAKEEIQGCLQEDKLSEEVGAELKLSPKSPFVNEIIRSFAQKVETEACSKVTNWCLCNSIDVVEQFFQHKASIKVNLSIDDIRLKRGSD